MATNPFELFLDYGLRIKARSEAPQTFIVQLACGARGTCRQKKRLKAEDTVPAHSAITSARKVVKSSSNRRWRGLTVCG